MPATPVATAPSASRAHVFTYPRVAFGFVSELKDRLRADLTTAMKARDELVKATLRMTLTNRQRRGCGHRGAGAVRRRGAQGDRQGGEEARRVGRGVRGRRAAGARRPGAGRG